MCNNSVYVRTYEEYGIIPVDVLRQTVILRWGYNENKINDWVNRMRKDLFGFQSFYIIAFIDERVVGYTYYCQNESDETQWYYGDLIVHDEYRRMNVASAMVERGISELQRKKATRLFTYIDNSNEASFSFHEKLHFFISEKQDPINGFLNDGRIVYERIV